MARNLVLHGTPKAIEGVISSLDGCAEQDEWYLVIDLLVAAKEVPDSRFEAILDSRRSAKDLRHAAAHILSRRGVTRGHEVLFQEFPSRTSSSGSSGADWMASGPCAAPSNRARSRRQTSSPTGSPPSTGRSRWSSTSSPTTPTPVRTTSPSSSWATGTSRGRWTPCCASRTIRPAARRYASGRPRPCATLQAPEAIDLIGRGLLDPESSEWRREYYLIVLGEIGNWAAIEPLEAAAAQDPDGWVGRCAREAIGMIKGGDEGGE